MTYHDRFKDAPWYEGSQNEQLLIGGAGGIGSNAAYSISKTIPFRSIFIVDFDIVESYNVGTQFFHEDTIGQPKVGAIANVMKRFGVRSINPINRDIQTTSLPISVAAFDNMKARKQLFENWKNRDDGKGEIFIDGRLRANMYEVYAVTPERIEQYEATLFDDDEVADDACTFKQTAYFAVLIGARIAHVLVNYLTNKYAGADICNIPFKIQEVGDPFFIKTE